MKLWKKCIWVAALLGFIFIVIGFALPFFSKPPIPIPSSAKWVRCSEWGVWLAYDLQVKFRAPYNDCLKNAELVLDENRKKFGGANGITNNSQYPRIEIKDGSYMTSEFYAISESAKDGLNKWWFTPQDIKNGIFIGNSGSYGPQIWIDKDRGIFYYKITD